MNNNMEKEVYQVSLDDIIPNRFQPRLTFDEEAMKELTASIKEHGVIQPLVLRRLGDKYEIIAGERRYKASTLAGLEKVPAVVMNLDDNKSAEVALVENIQRKQLSAIEEAKSYQQLLDRGYLTQDDLAKRLGKSQPGISNKMRLLNLSEDVQEALLANKISERHARSLLSLKSEEQQIEMLNRIINERMTVRQVDAAIKKMIEKPNEGTQEGGIQMNQETNPFTNINVNVEPTPINQMPPIEPITPIFPNQPAENMSSMKDGNNFINLTNPTTIKPAVNNDVEELDMDEDFKDIEPSSVQKMNEIDNLLKAQNQMPEFNPNIAQQQNAPQVPRFEFNTPPAPQQAPIQNQQQTMPIFNPNLNQPLQTTKRDIRPIISDIRQTVNNIQREGFVVDLEEFDYENTYQVVIKIQK